jgi:hypothetical protein
VHLSRPHAAQIPTTAAAIAVLLLTVVPPRSDLTRADDAPAAPPLVNPTAASPTTGSLPVAFDASAPLEQPREMPMRYALRARLDADRHVVDGSATIRWVNTSTVPVRELWLHLYMNAFRDDRSVFMRESGGQLRGDRPAVAGRGGIDVLELRAERSEGSGTVDLLPRSDTEVIPGDRTQMRVPLDTAVAPGESITLSARFRTTLPPIFARTGFHRDFHMVAQWFPKVARLEPDGRWSTFPYHGNGEFYADFATYELEIDVPEMMVVGATGRSLAAPTRAGGRAIHRFRADRVHDAAWTAWPHFRERRLRVRHEALDVDVRLLHPPGHQDALRRHEFILREGLRRYGALYGPYPHPTLTVVIPPRGAEGAAGMEYPTLITSLGPWLAIPGLRAPSPEEVTAHELAHQWFQGMIATNEVAWPMLDEGLTQHATTRLLADVFGRERSLAALWLGPAGTLTVDYFELQRLASLRGGDLPPPGSPAPAFDAREYGTSVYLRTAVVLETVRRTWGTERFDRALGAYARRYRFGHPEPRDLFGVFDEHYYVGFSRQVLEPALLRGESADTRIVRASSLPLGGGRHRTEVVVRRVGAVRVPVAIELRGEAGQRRRIAWRGAEDRLRVSHDGDFAVTHVVLDPDRHNLLDGNALDGLRATDAARSRAPTTTGLRWRILAALQALVRWVST